METLLDARRLTRRFGTRTAVDGVDLRLGRGEVVGFLGPNGAGKSTCLALLSGSLRPHAGEIRILDRELWSDPRAAKRHLGYLPEQPPLYPDLWVDEQLAYAGRLHGLKGGPLSRAVARGKALCGLEEVGRRLVGRLSKGYRQRLGIAQAILHGPDLVLLDEPTEGLDPLQIRAVRELIRALGRECGVLLSSHLLAEVQSVCHRVMILHRGRVVYPGAGGREPDRPGLRLTLSHPPDGGALAGLAGVAATEPLGGGEFRIRLAADGAPAELAAAVVRAGWGLQALCPEADALEQAFLRAVGGDPRSC